MSITYTNTRLDSVKWFLYRICRNRLYWCLIIAMTAIYTWLSSRGWPPKVVGSNFEKMFLATSFFLIYFTVQWTIALVVGVLFVLCNRSPGFHTQHSLTIAPGGFVEETSVNRTEHKWAGVQKVVKRQKYLMIYIGSNQAHIVPRRAFNNQADWDLFCAECAKFATA